MELVGKRVRDKLWDDHEFVDVEWFKENYLAGLDENEKSFVGYIENENLEILDKPAPKKLPSERITEIAKSNGIDIHNSVAPFGHAIMQYLDWPTS